MTQLRLLFVVQRYGTEIRGGAEQAARAVAERLAGRGHHVEVLSTTAESYVDWSGTLPPEERIGGVAVHRLTVRPLRDPTTFERLNHQLTLADPPAAPALERAWLDAQGPSVPDLEDWLDAEAGRFDVVVFFTYLYATTTVGLPVAARHTATALVPCAHDELPLQLHAFDRIAHLADALLLLTPEEAQLVRARFRMRAPQHVVGLGTDLDRVADEVDAARFRRRLGIGEGSYLLYVGRIDPSKGTSWLVDRFIDLLPHLPSDLHLVLLGDPVVAVAEHPRVHVVTDAQDVERDAAMAGAVALVHPSPHESFAMVVTEAWSQRTPVIAFGGNDVLRGHVERSGGGLLVTDGATLGAASKLLAEDRSVRDTLGDAGRAHVTAEHGWDTVIDRWEQALRDTAAGTRQRPPVTAPATPPPSETAPVPSDPPTAVHARPVRDDLPPEWLARPLALALGGLVGFSITGVGAAMAGWFRPVVVIPATLVVGVPLGWSAARALPRWSSTRSTHLAAAALLALVSLFTLHNLANHGQHVATDRDPGVYLTTAKHLLEEGDLLVQGPSGPFVDAPNLSSNGAGFSPERRDTTLEPQFPHLTASVLAASGWVHEVGMFLATPVVAGFALVCLYAFATLLAGPRWAVVATAMAGASMPVMIFSRDTYSEPLATALLFGGLWVLALAERSARWVPWLLAGLLLGATSMARVDGYLNLMAVALALALHLRLRSDEDRRSTWLAVGACTIGVAATSLLGFWDTAWLTGSYFRQSLGPRLPSMIAAALAAGAVGLVLAPLLWRRTRGAGGEGREPTLLLRVSLWATSAAVLAFFAWGYWVRPDPDGLPRTAVEGVSTLAFLPQAKTLSFRWLTWYLSPFGVVVGVLGLLAALLALGRSKRPPTGIVAGLAAIFITTLLYLWTPNVTPDHPWAMRRFAAVAIPGLAVGVAVLAHRLWRSGSPPVMTGRLRGPTARRAVRGVAGVAAFAVAFGATGATAAITWPVQDVRAQVPMRERIRQVCELAGDDAAILVPIDGILSLMFSVPAGVWCGVPAAGGAPGLGAADVARLAVAWQEEGRRLVVVSSSETPVMNTLLPSGIVAETIETDPVYPVALEPTIRVPPQRVVPDGRFAKGPDGAVVLRLYPIDADAARDYLERQLVGPCAPSRRVGGPSC